MNHPTPPPAPPHPHIISVVHTVYLKPWISLSQSWCLSVKSYQMNTEDKTKQKSGPSWAQTYRVIRSSPDPHAEQVQYWVLLLQSLPCGAGRPGDWPCPGSLPERQSIQKWVESLFFLSGPTICLCTAENIAASLITRFHLFLCSFINSEFIKLHWSFLLRQHGGLHEDKRSKEDQEKYQ